MNFFIFIIGFFYSPEPEFNVVITALSAVFADRETFLKSSFDSVTETFSTRYVFPPNDTVDPAVMETEPSTRPSI